MRIILHKNFIKQYKKLRLNKKRRFQECRDIFLTDPYEPILNNHPLRGAYKGYRSINVGGGLRVVYELINEDTAYFVAIDSHSKLYSS